MRNRTLAREISLQYLYLTEITKRSGFEVEHLRQTVSNFALANTTPAYIETLVSGVIVEKEKAVLLIQERAKNWHINRILPIDRILLRMGIYEMFNSEDVPYKVAINEAVELAKRFSSSKSGAFVNGILDSIGKDHGLR